MLHVKCRDDKVTENMVLMFSNSQLFGPTHHRRSARINLDN